MIQTWAKSGTPDEEDGEPYEEPGADAGPDPVGTSVGGDDDVGDGTADGADGDAGPVAQPSTTRTMSHANASGAFLRARSPTVPLPPPTLCGRPRTMSRRPPG